MDSQWVTGRIVFLNTHILALMMNVFYSAFIVSSLLSAPPKTIKTTRNLIDSNLQFGAEDINYERGYFELSNDPLVQELYHKKMAPPKKGYFSREIGLHKVHTELFAFHTEAINVYPMIEQTFSDKGKCDLTEILIFPIERGYMPVPWGSPHKERITYSYNVHNVHAASAQGQSCVLRKWSHRMTGRRTRKLCRVEANDIQRITGLFSVGEFGDSEMRPRIRLRLPGIHLTVGKNLGKKPNQVISPSGDRTRARAQLQIGRRTAGYTLLDRKRNEEILEQLEVESVEEKISRYKFNWLDHVRRMENSRIPKIMMQYKPRGHRRPGRPLRRLLDGAETALQRPNS
ncbi:hypothetical protein ANN_13552 [Periplaneta americana]|uniref:Uncharacterized protein n=1 Tax=Periplaneta americana TaxID=6978 RepID=A0ABQ8TLX4_PERAM|nr:hypothetical protein ANN_13552 [Periplaneta americana]